MNWYMITFRQKTSTYVQADYVFMAEGAAVFRRGNTTVRIVSTAVEFDIQLCAAPPAQKEEAAP